MAFDVKQVYSPSSWRLIVWNVIVEEVIAKRKIHRKFFRKNKPTWNYDIIFEPGYGFG